MKPFIKWAGGKIKMTPLLIEKMPKKYNRYIEPFIGGGALLLTLQPENAIISDLNSMLINCYIQIRDNIDELIQQLKILEDEFNISKFKSEYYYTKRELYNNTKSENINSAALFIFLNKTGFNGMHRENKDGKFNVPFGQKTKITLYSEKNLREISTYLQNISCLSGDFEDVCKKLDLQDGDFVFFDSPYIDTFDLYNGNRFGDENHQRLKMLYDFLSKKGVYCMATNNCCETVKEMYKEYFIEDVNVIHSINRNGNDRTAKEVIITNY